MPPGTTCSPTSKDTTIVSGFIPLSGISPPNRQSAKQLNPMSTKSGEGQYVSRATEETETEKETETESESVQTAINELAFDLYDLNGEDRATIEGWGRV